MLKEWRKAFRLSALLEQGLLQAQRAAASLLCTSAPGATLRLQSCMHELPNMLKGFTAGLRTHLASSPLQKKCASMHAWRAARHLQMGR